MDRDLVILHAIIKAKGNCGEAERQAGFSFYCGKCVINVGCSGNYDITLEYALDVYKEKYGFIKMLKDTYEK